MSELLAQWLRLREAADHASRHVGLTDAVVRALDPRGSARVVDLATGTGSNLRYLIPKLPPRQQWLAVDLDPDLLGTLVIQTSVWAANRGLEVETRTDGLVLRGAGLHCVIETRALDLGSVEAWPALQDVGLVTASALLDLVSPEWLDHLASRAFAAGAHALFPIVYDGQSSCDPAEAEDERIRALLNRHQHRDKGLGGPAAGPEATEAARRALAAAGYQVGIEPSDWRLGPPEAEMQRVLVDGWAEAALELAPGDADLIASWRVRRHRHIDARHSAIRVGHFDLAALHPGL